MATAVRRSLSDQGCSDHSPLEDLEFSFLLHIYRDLGLIAKRDCNSPTDGNQRPWKVKAPLSGTASPLAAQTHCSTRQAGQAQPEEDIPLVGSTCQAGQAQPEEDIPLVGSTCQAGQAQPEEDIPLVGSSTGHHPAAGDLRGHQPSSWLLWSCTLRGTQAWSEVWSLANWPIWLFKDCWMPIKLPRTCTLLPELVPRTAGRIAPAHCARRQQSRSILRAGSRGAEGWPHEGTAPPQHCCTGHRCSPASQRAVGTSCPSSRRD